MIAFFFKVNRAAKEWAWDLLIFFYFLITISLSHCASPNKSVASALLNKTQKTISFIPRTRA
jgi:hypothetical protein